jgi:ATP synthase protein I
MPDRSASDKNQSNKPGDASDGSGESGGSSGGATSGLIGSWIQAEKMIQVALMLPCAGFIGWAIGAGLDRWLHQTWISMAGIVLGIIAGLIGAIQMAIASAAGPKRKGGNGDGSASGSSARQS